MTLNLVGCGKQKLDHAAPARELYTGSLFRAARRYVESRAEPWLIVSAKYGIVRPYDVLEPYEQSLTRRERDVWAAKVAAEVVARWPRLSREVVLFMGMEYATPLHAELSWRGVSVREPLMGLGLGERLQWFKRRTGKKRPEGLEDSARERYLESPEHYAGAEGGPW